MLNKYVASQAWNSEVKARYMSCLKTLAPTPQIVRSVPEAATTVLCTADDGRDGRPKHVEEFSSK